VAKKILNNGDSALTHRTYINDNFTELYLEKTSPTHTHTAADTTVTAVADLTGPNVHSVLQGLDSRITTNTDNITAIEHYNHVNLVAASLA